MLKTGKDHVASLRDGREIHIDGGRVDDVTTHPAFRRVVESVAGLYDFQSRPENIEMMTFDTGSGERANRIWQLPRSHAELVERRQALVAWTELHGGFLGRAPDHVASCIAGMYMGSEVFREYDPKRAKALGANPLDEIPGIGTTRKRALLKHFGSAKAVSRAGVDDLVAVDGISAEMARKIYDFFHERRV